MYVEGPNIYSEMDIFSTGGAFGTVFLGTLMIHPKRSVKIDITKLFLCYHKVSVVAVVYSNYYYE